MHLSVLRRITLRTMLTPFQILSLLTVAQAVPIAPAFINLQVFILKRKKKVIKSRPHTEPKTAPREPQKRCLSLGPEAHQQVGRSPQGLERDPEFVRT